MVNFVKVDIACLVSAFIAFLNLFPLVSKSFILKKFSNAFIDSFEEDIKSISS